MPRPAAIIIGAVLLALLVITNTVFIVRQDRQAIVLTLGEFSRAINPIGADEPGVKFKIPFVESVVFFDKRNLGLTLEGQPIVAADQERLIVDAIVRWRITDPLRFYQNAQTEEGGATRIETFTEAAMRRALGTATSNAIISGQRAELMQRIEDDLNASAVTELGVRVIDVRIRQADLPQETQARVYERMRSERAQVAGRIRAEGDREATIIRARAQEESERTRGEGEGQRARIFAQAYGRDPEFAAFYRSMRAYETALEAGTPIVVPPDSDFFRYMQNRGGGR
ncbi:MAG: protease modulator HflC [Hyphomonadaceae bacterium]